MSNELFKEIKEYLLREEVVTTDYDDKSITILEFGDFENKLENAGVKEDIIPLEARKAIASKLQDKFKFANIQVSEYNYIDFDFTLLKEDVNCNIKYIVNAIHSFHDSFQREVNQYVESHVLVHQ